MKQVVIIAGGFHPFHAGHYSLYTNAKEKYPKADIYFAASDSTIERPFPFKLKQQLASLFGINAEQFVQTKSPYKPVEITSKYNPESTQVIFIRSRKDRNENPKPHTKKDGSPGYFQHVSVKMKPFSKHAYMDYLPTIKFGPGIKSASEIRDVWPTLSIKRKQAMIYSLYPSVKSNTKLLDKLVEIFDNVIGGSDTLSESDEKKEKDLDAIDINATALQRNALAYIRRHYPEAPSTQAAFVKFVINSLMHSEEDSNKNANDIADLQHQVDNLEQEVEQLSSYSVSEASQLNEIGVSTGSIANPDYIPE